METKGTIKVVMADRDGLYMKKVKACLEAKGGIHVVGMASSGDQALKLVKNLKPDVLLMDALLDDKDGFWVQEMMKKNGLTVKACIIASAMGSDMVVRKAMGLGADYFMVKPIQGDILLERMEQLVRSHSAENFEEEIVDEVEHLSTETPHIANLLYENLEADISNILSRMGISASIKGYHYIRKAVMMAVEDEEIMIGITKGLYPDIAKAYKTTASKVERAIRHAIESSWKKNGREVFLEVAGYFSPDKPTNGQFIAALSEYFRLNYKRNQKRTA
ncbi:MAG: sporulation transcription factor Spo0A [Epulopiscium sp.]|nr:sporulation transcription factor Spo0A [Candidatus Epulonipiscium sp.]